MSKPGRLAAIALLTASSVAVGAQEASDRHVVLPYQGPRPSVWADGTTVVYVRDGSISPSLGRLLGPDHVVQSRAELLLAVDRQGIQWWHGDGAIIGRLGGIEVVRHAIGERNFPSPPAEDSHGRIWLPLADGVLWLDRDGWSELSVEIPVQSNTRPQLRVTASADGSHVYLWQQDGAAFIDITGVEPTFTRVDRSRGLREHSIYELVAVGNSSVLTTYGFSVYSADEWTQEPAGTPGPMHRSVHTRILGQYELAHHPMLLGTFDGAAYVVASRALEWGAGATPSVEHDSTIWSNPAPAVRLPQHGQNVIFRVSEERGVERVAPEIESFEPTRVDRRGTFWRQGYGRDLHRFENGRAYQLVHRDDSRPVSGVSMSRTDRSGRVFLTTSDQSVFVHTPVGQAPTAAMGATSPLIWKPVTHRTFDRESEVAALSLVRNALEKHDFRDVRGAAWIYPTLDLAGTPLRHAAIWRKIASPLRRLVRAPNELPPLDLAKVALALDRVDLAAKTLERALRSTEKPDRTRERERALASAIELTTLADELDMFDIAFLGYEKVLKKPYLSEGHRTWMTGAAAHCAVRAGRWALAREYYARHEACTRTVQMAEAIKAQQLLSSLLNAIDDPSAHVTFIREYYTKPARRPGAKKAWLGVLQAFELDAEPARNVYTALLRIAASESDVESAREWASGIIASSGVADEVCAESLYSVASIIDAEAHPVEAITEYAAVIARYAQSGPACSAKCAIGQIEEKRGRPGAAIEWYLKCLEGDEAIQWLKSSSGAAAQHNACTSLSRTYESVGDLENALKYARLTLSKHRMRTFCGTCATSSTSSAQSRVEALEARMKRTKDPDNSR